MGPHAACPDLDHNRDVRLDLCRGLDPCDLCHHQGPVPCVHEQYHGRTGPACAVLRLGRHYRSVSLLEALARAAPGTHRHEILVEGYSSGRARHGPLHARRGDPHPGGRDHSLADWRAAYAGIPSGEDSRSAKTVDAETSIRAAMGEPT